MKFLHKADEGTSIIRERLKAGDDIFIGCEEARLKYQHVLNPTLEQWEAYNLDENGSTMLIRERLLKGRDVFDGCQDAKDKYGYLIPTELEKWEHIFLDHERGFKSCALSCGFNLDDRMFRNCEEARTVYGWITAPCLEQWEKLYLDDDGGTTWIQEQLLDEKSVFYACDKAAAKYAHLTPTRLESWEYKNLFRFSGVTTGLENYMRQNENVFELCEKARLKYQHLALPAYKWLRDVDQSRLDKEEAEERKILRRREDYAGETGVMVTPILDISAQPNYLGSDFDTSSDESASESSSSDSGDSYHTARGPSRGKVTGSCCSHGAGDDASIKCLIV